MYPRSRPGSKRVSLREPVVNCHVSSLSASRGTSVDFPRPRTRHTPLVERCFRTLSTARLSEWVDVEDFRLRVVRRPIHRDCQAGRTSGRRASLHLRPLVAGAVSVGGPLVPTSLAVGTVESSLRLRTPPEGTGRSVAGAASELRGRRSLRGIRRGDTGGGPVLAIRSTPNCLQCWFSSLQGTGSRCRRCRDCRAVRKPNRTGLDWPSRGNHLPSVMPPPE